MLFAILIFGAIFILVGSIGLLLFYRESMLERIQEVVNPTPKERTTSILGTLEGTKSSVGSMIAGLNTVMPKSQSEVSVIRQRMTHAGYREESAVKIFYGCKVLVPVVLCIVAFATGLGNKGGFFVYAACLGIGFLGPDFWLGKQIKKRQRRIRRGLPDVLDLLVICVEAGLSLDQATARTSEELHQALPDLCDELSMVVLEQRAGRARADAWKNLSERTGEESVRNMVSMLVQSEQLGTSVAKTLRVHSDTLRTQRIQQVEEMAAKTSVKLVFPLVFFIFPSLFLVCLGPAAIQMMDTFKQLLGE